MGAQEKEISVNFNPRLSAIRPSNNWVLWIKFEPSALALKRIFGDLNGVAVVSDCCIGPIPCSLHLTLLHV